MWRELSGSDVALDFAHNAAGQILSRDRISANGSYVYPQPGMNVDAYASNGLNQIASLDGAALAYDARGNLTSAGGVSYTYDAFNRLLSAGGISLAYDPAGRLYETTASGTTTRFLYDGLQAIAECNTSGTLLRRYVPGAGLDEPITWYEGSGTSDLRYFIQDDLGTVISVADGTGAARSVNSYDEYGMPASGNAGLFGYTGQMYLSQAGLYHYRARAYSPSLGRFLQTDPIGMAGGMNLYAYVQDDPVNWRDPNGQNPIVGALALGCLGGMIGVGIEEATNDIIGFSTINVLSGCPEGAGTVAIAALTVAALPEFGPAAWAVGAAAEGAWHVMWDDIRDDHHEGDVREDGSIVGALHSPYASPYAFLTGTDMWDRLFAVGDGRWVSAILETTCVSEGNSVRCSAGETSVAWVGGAGSGLRPMGGANTGVRYGSGSMCGRIVSCRRPPRKT